MIELPMLSYKHRLNHLVTAFMKSTPNVVKSVIRNVACLDIRNFLMAINGRNGKRLVVTMHC